MRLPSLVFSLLIVVWCHPAVGQHQAPTAAIRFSEHLIADKYAYAYGIAAADIDGDGDLDLTSADYTPHNMLYLFENDSQGNFRKHHIQTNDPVRLERHMVGDIDRDGDLDVVIVKNLYGHLLWFENSGTPNDDKLWRRHVITLDLPGAYDVALADFDQDGDLDVAGSSWVLGNQFAWFENDGTPKEGEWKKHMIEQDVAETRTMRAADFDGDGDMDLLGTGRKANQVIWYENHRASGSVAWKKHLIDDKSVCPAHGNPADMDGDGDLDVVMALGFYYRPGSGEVGASLSSADNQVVWYENNGRPAAGGWKKHVIGANFDDAFEAIAGDLDGDGDLDVAATSWRTPGRIGWFENLGDPKGKWAYHVLKDNWRSANQVIIADLNGDGRPDIAACAEHGSYELRWWRNEGRTAAAQEATAPIPPKVRVALIGDSTVTDQAGWGAAFAQLLGPQAECLNFARGGQSSKSFLDQKRWLEVLWARPQYILIQFGHNDMPGKGPHRETDPQTTYTANLARYVHEARAAGAIPILVTPMVRRNFTPEGTVRMELAPWAEAARKVAKEKQVPLVDLNARSAELVKKLGPKKAAELDPESKDPSRGDHTHLSKRGAELIAPLVADELKQVEPNLAKLLKDAT